MLATFNEKDEEIPNGAIFVKGNVIEWVGSTADLPEKYSTADEVMSMKNHLILPGMVGLSCLQCTTVSSAAYSQLALRRAAEICIPMAGQHPPSHVPVPDALRRPGLLPVWMAQHMLLCVGADEGEQTVGCASVRSA